MPGEAVEYLGLTPHRKYRTKGVTITGKTDPVQRDRLIPEEHSKDSRFKSTLGKMKTLSIIPLVVSMAALVATAQAQEISIATVNMTRLYNEYHKTKEANAKLQESVEKAKLEAEELVKQGQELVEEYKEVMERSQNPALTEEAQNKAATESEVVRQGIIEKEQEVQQFQMATQRSLQQRQRTYRDLFLDEIRKVALEVAKENGRNLVIDSSGISGSGIPVVLGSASSWDITEEVLERINADALETE